MSELNFILKQLINKHSFNALMVELRSIIYEEGDSIEDMDHRVPESAYYEADSVVSQISDMIGGIIEYSGENQFNVNEGKWVENRLEEDRRRHAAAASYNEQTEKLQFERLKKKYEGK